jgi:RNA polymerase sigma factor (sigma-70 family)
MATTAGDLLKLFLAERSRLVRAIGRIVGSRATAEDIAQDTYLRLQGQPVSDSDKGLLFRTARNLAIDHLRAGKVRAAYAETLPREEASSEPQADAAMIAREEFDEFLAALRTLPERTQRVFLLNRLDGMTYGSIAAALGVSVSTVEKDMIRALELCRRFRGERTNEGYREGKRSMSGRGEAEAHRSDRSKRGG